MVLATKIYGIRLQGNTHSNYINVHINVNTIKEMLFHFVHVHVDDIGIRMILVKINTLKITKH